MSIDHYYTKIDGQWVCTNLHVIGGNNIPAGDRPNFHTDFWVDICHGGDVLIDERYYFEDLASALEFYLDGWRDRQLLGDDEKSLGLDHSGLYSRGRLIHGRSIHGEAPGHEGENLRRICEEYARKLDVDE
jgi:hypothetical protein